MSTRKIAFAAVIAAVYAALTILLMPISYGPVQFRISEVLCILPFFFPFSVWGLFVGCILANLLSAYGALDIVFGSLATLTAAYLTMRLGREDKGSLKTKIFACLPPVFINGIVVGALIAYETTTSLDAFWPAFMVNGLQVGFGELVVLFALGLPALIFLPRTNIFKTLIALYRGNAPQ
ncbi:QueT transporter family protein [Oscillospiraceae bacterium CM]|nr:QueT transporter family protein [Oscillospiraceae bacterium CM]